MQYINKINLKNRFCPKAITLIACFYLAGATNFLSAGYLPDLLHYFSGPKTTCAKSSLNTKNLSLIGAGVIVTCATAVAIYKAYAYTKHHESRIKFNVDLAKLDASSLKFNNTEPFLFGVATSAYQVEGRAGFNEDENGSPDKSPRNQWESYEGKTVTIDGKECIPVPQVSGDACNHWNLYEKDIDLAAKLGFNTFRISIAWEKVEPKIGVFNEKALQHYEDVCAYMVKNGIRPIITFHHYTDPCWFFEIGAFEKEENLALFVDFCEKVFRRLNKYNPLWFTFNTFEGYAIPGYSQGMKPPFKKDWQLALNVFKNMLQAHVQVYRKLKQVAVQLGQESHIGIYKNMYQLDPKNLLNPIDIAGCKFGNYLSNGCIYNFFNTGVLKLWIPTKGNINYVNKEAIGAFDQIGLNHYSCAYMDCGKITTRPECPKTQNDRYCVYPEGLYRVLKEISENLAKPNKKPIYITENGIATENAALRDIFYRGNLYAISRAKQEGVDIRGYVTWTLMDNYEWTYGYDKVSYGLCTVDKQTQERKLKEGTQFLLDIVKANKSK